MSDSQSGSRAPEKAGSVNSHQSNGNVVDNPWRHLREFTNARIGLGRAGVSLPTKEMLAFQLSHAQARDAVHVPLDVDALCQQLQAVEAFAAGPSPIRLHSQAPDRMTYLQRPDLGRVLDEASRAQLVGRDAGVEGTDSKFDLAIVIVDGLSSLAVQKNAVPLVEYLTGLLRQQHDVWTLAPVTVVEQGRVAIGDDIGERLNARAVLVLIGERPGLSSPDSLGLYLTWNPHTGLNDASRNCISNIRPAGLSFAEAASRALYLLREAKRLKLSGVNLKDRTEDTVIEHQTGNRNFLISQ
ncbi:MAG: ethanolamine ammonia-lyase subunit EutC [Gammaproteobacteria bacterium]|nr:ethanolamine ammonia-lyase subunit EutC [Gammaproteobacteria bacterium]